MSRLIRYSWCFYRIMDGIYALYAYVAFYVVWQRVTERSGGPFCQEHTLTMKLEGKWDAPPGAVFSPGCFSHSTQQFPPRCAWEGTFSNAQRFHPKQQQQEVELVLYLQFCSHRFWNYIELLGQRSQDSWPMWCLFVVASKEGRLWVFHHATRFKVYKGDTSSLSE